MGFRRGVLLLILDLLWISIVAGLEGGGLPSRNEISGGQSSVKRWILRAGM